MVDIGEILARAQLDSVRERALEAQQVRELATGVFEPPAEYILPGFPQEPNAHAAAVAAWRRIRRQVNSIGPKILNTLTNAIIGDITWSGDSNRLDDLLEGLDLPGFASDRLADLLIDGITACYAYEAPDGEIKITALSGYLEPFWESDNRDRIQGLYQADSYIKMQGRRAEPRWFVRFYDWSERRSDGLITVREWRDLQSPTAFSGSSMQSYDRHPPVRWRILQRTPEGYPIGPLHQAAPMLLSLMASEYRIARLEEYAAHPVPVFEDGRVQSVGPGLPVTGAFRWERPGDLSELREQRALKLEAIRDFIGLPGGLLGRGNTPSGEALREANQRLYQTASRMASILSSLLSQLLTDYAALHNIREPVTFTITPNRDYIRENVVQQAVLLYEKNLLPLDVAARSIQPFFNWPDAEFNQWIEQQTARITPEQARLQIEAAMGNTDGE